MGDALKATALNRFDLSTLAPSIFHWLVRTGDDFTTRQLAIAK
ncbi:hypothetical protein [Hymenobacter polaris]|nr:hypothetical protein [Hymenobacter polaris]